MDQQFNLLNWSLFFLLFLLFLKLFRVKKVNLLPPSPPKLPIIGNLHQLSKYPHRSLQALAEKYGSLMFLQLGWTPTLVVSSAEMVREIFKNHDISFSNRPKSTAGNLLFYGYKDIGFSPYGEYWRGLKKISTLELLSQKRVHEFQYVREEEVEILVNKLHEASSAGLSVNISELITTNSNNIVARCIFGEKFEDENGKSRFGALTRKMAKLVVAFSVGDFFPAFGWIDNITGLTGQLKETSQALDTFLEQLIAEHRSKKKDDFQGGKEDFVDILLQVQQKDDLGFEFTQESLKAILEVFLFPTLHTHFLVLHISNIFSMYDIVHLRHNFSWFFLWFHPKSFIPMEFQFLTYIPVIFSFASQCGTLVALLTILSSNEGRPVHPSNSHLSMLTM